MDYVIWKSFFKWVSELHNPETTLWKWHKKDKNVFSCCVWRWQKKIWRCRKKQSVTRVWRWRKKQPYRINHFSPNKLYRPNNVLYPLIMVLWAFIAHRACLINHLIISVPISYLGPTMSYTRWIWSSGPS